MSDVGHGSTPPGASANLPQGPIYEQLYSVSIEVVFSATPEEADARVREIVSRIHDLEAVWEVEADFDPDQKTETVDA